MITKSSRVVCRCGLSYQLSNEGLQKKPRCPVCGNTLKESPRLPEELALESSLWNRVKVGVGITSVFGMMALLIAIIVISSRDPHDSEPPTTGTSSTIATTPNRAAKPVTAPSPNTIDPIGVPVGRIGGDIPSFSR